MAFITLIQESPVWSSIIWASAYLAAMKAVCRLLSMNDGDDE